MTGVVGDFVDPYAADGRSLGRHAQDLALPEHAVVERELGDQTGAGVLRGQGGLPLPHRRLQGGARVHRGLHLPVHEGRGQESDSQRGDVSQAHRGLDIGGRTPCSRVIL